MCIIYTYTLFYLFLLVSWTKYGRRSTLYVPTHVNLSKILHPAVIFSFIIRILFKFVWNTGIFIHIIYHIYNNNIYYIVYTVRHSIHIYYIQNFPIYGYTTYNNKHKCIIHIIYMLYI